MRKPAFSYAKTKQCFRYKDSTIPLHVLPKYEIHLWLFESELVGNPEARFSPEVTQIWLH